MSNPNRDLATGDSPAKLLIGEVLRELRAEFPTVTLSKIRYLEQAELIDPERTASGHRRYSRYDIARLRYVLVAQRDEYLPLRVIKERLDRGLLNLDREAPSRPVFQYETASPDLRGDDVRAPKSLSLVVYAELKTTDRAWDRLLGTAQVLAESLGYAEASIVEMSHGSVFRWEQWRRVLSRDEVADRLLKVERAVELTFLGAKQAEVDARQAQAFRDLVEALADVPRACVRIGSLLLTKFGLEDGPVVLARNLSPLEMIVLERYPEIQRNPEKALEMLATAVASEPDLSNIDGRPDPL